jgi:hypothetical protein
MLPSASVHGAAQASSLTPPSSERAEAVLFGLGQPAGPPLLRLRSPRAVAAKPPDTHIDGPLTRALAMLWSAVL